MATWDIYWDQYLSHFTGYLFWFETSLKQPAGPAGLGFVKKNMNTCFNSTAVGTIGTDKEKHY